MLLKGLIWFLMGFFFLGLIVIYELSLFDKDLEKVLSKYEAKTNDLKEKTSLFNENYFPTVVVITENEPQQRPQRPAFASRRLRNYKLRNNYRNRHHSFSPQFAEFLLNKNDDTYQMNELRPTKAFQRAEHAMNYLTGEMRMPEESPKNDFSRYPITHAVEESLKKQLKYIDLVRSFVQDSKQAASNDESDFVKAYKKAHNLHYEPENMRSKQIKYLGTQENYAFELDPKTKQYRPRTPAAQDTDLKEAFKKAHDLYSEPTIRRSPHNKNVGGQENYEFELDPKTKQYRQRTQAVKETEQTEEFLNDIGTPFWEAKEQQKPQLNKAKKVSGAKETDLIGDIGAPFKLETDVAKTDSIKHEEQAMNEPKKKVYYKPIGSTSAGNDDKMNNVGIEYYKDFIQARSVKKHQA